MGNCCDGSSGNADGGCRGRRARAAGGLRLGLEFVGDDDQRGHVRNVVGRGVQRQLGQAQHHEVEQPAAESSDELETSFSAPSPTTTVGGDTTSLDAQSTTWFDTMCTGMAPLNSLQNVTSQQELSDAMTQAGQAFQATGSQLATLPPPTFDGGAELAQSATSGFQSFGQTFIDFGQKVLDIDDNDTAAQQQFTSDLAAAAATSPVAQIRLTHALTQAVQAIPSCQSLFSSGS